MYRVLLPFVLLSGAATAADPDGKAIAAILQPLLVKQLKTPALDSRHNWNHQAEFVTGWDLKHVDRFRWTRTPIVEKKNDGTWTHFSLDIPDPARNLSLEISELRTLDPGVLRFEAALRSKDVHLRIEQQIWKRGLRLMSHEIRATCTAAVHVTGVVTTKLVRKPGQFLPETIVQAKVTKAEIFYQDLKVQHALGVGGDAAKLIGEAAQKAVQLVKPGLEKDLIAKAEAAIVTAGQTKEVKLGLPK